MTLIAAFWADDVPVLIGDFMISIKGDNRRVPISTAQKVHLISDNFAVAWTGNQLAAVEVMTDIYNMFHGQKVTLDGLQEFFQTYPAQENLRDQPIVRR